MENKQRADDMYNNWCAAQSLDPEDVGSMTRYEELFEGMEE